MKTVLIDGKEYSFIGVSSVETFDLVGRLVKHFVHAVDQKTKQIIVVEHDKCTLKVL